MAPTRPAPRRRTGSFGTPGEGFSPGAFKNKNGKQRTWRPNHLQAFAGSVREGRGFALRRRLRAQRQYSKSRWRAGGAPAAGPQLRDRLPDHLRHLYLAEEERLRRPRGSAGEQAGGARPGAEEQRAEGRGGFSTIPKKNKKKTSNQKAQEEYERVQAQRAAKKQEFERRKQEREEAQRLYKKKKMEVFKILSKKTKKGQPNLNLQMEYLLKKIQENN